MNNKVRYYCELLDAVQGSFKLMERIAEALKKSTKLLQSIHCSNINDVKSLIDTITEENEALLAEYNKSKGDRQCN